MKISVIVPVFKTEKYLRRCVDSIRAQKHKELEIILVDDGSPDGCPALCDAMASEDGRIRVIHQANAGVSAARNAGLEAATGDYIAFVDSDDHIEPEMYSSMLAESGGCDVIMCDCVKDYGDRSELYTHDIRAGEYDAEQLRREYYPHLLMTENVEYPPTISSCVLLFRRECCGEPGLRYELGVRYSEDLLFGARLMRRAGSFRYLKGRAYYHYCMNPQSATHVYAPDKWRDYMRLHRRIRECFSGDGEYDFGEQIDKCLLFFVYNAAGDIYGAPLPAKEKKEKLCGILDAEPVREMFGRLRVAALQVSWKQRVVTWCYKHRAFIRLLVWYYR